MGTIASTRAYGHFGRSGSFLLVDPDRGLVVAALAARPFGTWAVKAWPTWMDALFDRFGA
jgi:CubicO group peptidase (beta-lactamase class C family)